MVFLSAHFLATTGGLSANFTPTCALPKSEGSSRNGSMLRQSLSRFGVPLTVALMAQLSCGDRNEGTCNIARCGTPAAGIVLLVTAATGGGAVIGVQATLSGPATLTLSCEPGMTATSCSLGSGPLIEGSYSLRVTAPGFREADLGATITFSPPASCECASAKLEPSSLTLDPS